MPLEASLHPCRMHVNKAAKGAGTRSASGCFVPPGQMQTK